MRFKVDENLPAAVAELLAAEGFEADTVHDESLVGAPDAEIARVLLREDRALLTLDTDFANISEYDPKEYPGLVVLRPRRQDSGSIHALVTSLVRHLHAHELRGHLWILEPDRIRIRG